MMMLAPSARMMLRAAVPVQKTTFSDDCLHLRAVPKQLRFSHVAPHHPIPTERCPVCTVLFPAPYIKESLRAPRRRDIRTLAVVHHARVKYRSTGSPR